MRQLERLINIPIGQLDRELKSLEKIGFLESSMDGNLRKYRVNVNFLVYEELKNIFLKTVGIGDIIREDLGKDQHVELAFIYGSFAKGEENIGSDLDVMIVGSASDKKLNTIFTNLEKKLNRAVNYSLYDRGEIENRLKQKDGFICTVFSEPNIILIGNRNDDLFGSGKKK